MRLCLCFLGIISMVSLTSCSSDTTSLSYSKSMFAPQKTVSKRAVSPIEDNSSVQNALNMMNGVRYGYANYDDIPQANMASLSYSQIKENKRKVVKNKNIVSNNNTSNLLIGIKTAPLGKIKSESLKAGVHIPIDFSDKNDKKIANNTQYGKLHIPGDL